MCCFYVEFMHSYDVCLCPEVRFQKTCSRRHLSSYFPWEKRFDHRPGEELHDVRQIAHKGPDPLCADSRVLDSDEEVLPFKTNKATMFRCIPVKK